MRSVMLLVAVFVMFFFALTLGIFTYVAVTVDDTFEDINFTIANTDFQTVYQDNLGIGLNSFIDNADTMGMFLLFGMMILMIICGYIFNSNSKLLLVIDIVIFIIIFILAGILQFTYNEVIHSGTELLDIYSNNIEKTSTFMLLLPFVVPIIWLIMMIITYGRFKKKDFKESTSEFGGVGF